MQIGGLVEYAQQTSSTKIVLELVRDLCGSEMRTTGVVAVRVRSFRGASSVRGAD